MKSKLPEKAVKTIPSDSNLILFYSPICLIHVFLGLCDPLHYLFDMVPLLGLFSSLPASLYLVFETQQNATYYS